MNISFGMTPSSTNAPKRMPIPTPEPNPYYHTDILAKKKEPQYIDAKLANNILDNLKTDVNREIDNAKEQIAKQSEYDYINRIPADLLKSLVGLVTPEYSTPIPTPTPTPTTTSELRPFPEPTP